MHISIGMMSMTKNIFYLSPFILLLYFLDKRRICIGETIENPFSPPGQTWTGIKDSFELLFLRESSLQRNACTQKLKGKLLNEDLMVIPFGSIENKFNLFSSLLCAHPTILKLHQSCIMHGWYDYTMMRMMMRYILSFFQFHEMKQRKRQN